MKNSYFKTRCTSTHSFTLLLTIFFYYFSLAVSVNAQQINAQLAIENVQDIINEDIPFDKISTGSLYFKRGEHYLAALTQQSDYQVKVNGLLASVNFTQTFQNSSDDFLEAVYVFPLIDDASVSSMLMEIGERRIVGKIKEKQRAQQLYTKAKKQGKKVSLVSQQRPNLFTTQLANIAPGETIKISLSYVQSVTLNDDIFALRIPLTLTPRYIPTVRKSEVSTKTSVIELTENHNITNTGLAVEPVKIPQTTQINSSGWAVNNARVPDASEITPFQTRLDPKMDPLTNSQQLVSISVNVNSGLQLANITSLYHRINHAHDNNKHLISLKDKAVRLDQDFVLQWQLSQGNTPKAAFFKQTSTDIQPNNSQYGSTQHDKEQYGNEQYQNYEYGLLMLMPPKAAAEKAISKDVVYIIDTSGSMGGVAIKQAKQALIKALDFLKPTDTFNIVAFNTNYQKMFSSNKQANSQQLTYAKQWISTLTASGGTNMYPAIEQALQSSLNANTYKQVVFITDGSVGNETELLSLIDKKLGSTRLHTIGIGSAPNGYFMSEAAKVGRGTYRYIGSINEVNNQMTQLFSKISTPLLKNIELTWPTEQVEFFPKKIPDLYAGLPILISARWLKEDQQPLTNLSFKITGQLADTTWTENVDIANNNMPINNKFEDNGIAQWWAKNKIDHLLTLHRRSDSDTRATLQSQVTKLALQHQLLSPYTSFIAIEEVVSRSQDASLKKQAIKNLMPKGSTQAVPLANTALGVMKYFYIGLLFLCLAFITQLAIRFRVQTAC